MNPYRSYGVTDGVAKEGVLVIGVLNNLALLRVGRRKNQAAVHRECETAGKEQGNRQHVRGVVMKVQVLISHV